MNRDLIRNKIKGLCDNVRRYEMYNDTVIYRSQDNKKHVVKANCNNIIEIYNYLNSRGFPYLPKLEYVDDDIYVYEFNSDAKTPSEQRMSDLIKLDALLHNKTVYYKDTSLDEIKEIYESLNTEIENTFNYYDDVITMIESKIYMSPSEYMLARNCSSVFSCINFCKKELDDWYELIKNKSKKRVVLLHNNLDASHLIRSNDNLLISWNKAKRDLPIYDFINLYKKCYEKYDFNELYKDYLKKFPLNKEERKLMFIILFLPPKIKFTNKEINNTKNVATLCNYLVTTDKLFMENEAKNTKEQDGKIYE